MSGEDDRVDELPEGFFHSMASGMLSHFAW